MENSSKAALRRTDAAFVKEIKDEGEHAREKALALGFNEAQAGAIQKFMELTHPFNQPHDGKRFVP
ncbi:MAG TPA: hypothetical protein VIG74_03665 [Alphaproteobacteria bacterium]|jgi:hypothetical protein